MKIICDQVGFAKALNTVAKAISGNTTLPVLENILLKAEGSILTLMATNLEISISTYIEVTVEKEGEITLPSKILVSYISLLPSDSPITLEVLDGFTAQISTKKSKTKIKGIDAQDFPLIPKVEAKETLALERTAFLDAVSSVIFSTATNTTRPILSGVLFVIEKNRLTLASTDSFRLSEKKLDTPNVEPKETLKMIVPAKTLAEVMKIFVKDEAEASFIHIHVGANQVQFEAGETKLISRLIEGVFPDYRQIIPAEYATFFDVEKEELINILKRVNLFAKDNNFQVKLNVEVANGKLTVHCDGVQSGEEEAVMNVQNASGENVMVALNSTFMLDILGNAKATTVKMKFASSVKPTAFSFVRNKEEDTSYMHLIMPLRS